jgi:hypothetical protein
MKRTVDAPEPVARHLCSCVHAAFVASYLTSNSFRSAGETKRVGVEVAKPTRVGLGRTGKNFTLMIYNQVGRSTCGLLLV